MTREEIIAGLKFTVDMFLFDPNTGETFTEPRNDMDKITIDACKGAIELLEQEPCEDCISRQATLKALCDNSIPIVYKGKPSFVVDYAKVLESIPPVKPQEPKTGWIPVSERLPEHTDYYLIQYSRKICADEMAVAFYSVEEAELDKDYTWEFKPQCGEYKDIIAWMPLPEPYKEGRR